MFFVIFVVAASWFNFGELTYGNFNWLNNTYYNYFSHRFHTDASVSSCMEASAVSYFEELPAEAGSGQNRE